MHARYAERLWCAITGGVHVPTLHKRETSFGGEYLQRSRSEAVATPSAPFNPFENVSQDSFTQVSRVAS